MDPHAGCLQQCCPVLRHLPVTSPSRRSNCRKSVPASTALQIKRNKNKNLSVQNQLCVIKACTADTITALEISIQAWKKKKKQQQQQQKKHTRNLIVGIWLYMCTCMPALLLNMDVECSLSLYTTPSHFQETTSEHIWTCLLNRSKMSYNQNILPMWRKYIPHCKHTVNVTRGGMGDLSSGNTPVWSPKELH